MTDDDSEWAVEDRLRIRRNVWTRVIPLLMTFCIAVGVIEGIVHHHIVLFPALMTLVGLGTSAYARNAVQRMTED